ncbi:hypothetical protein Leryth_015267 [Lithospermum erythrorhizon]|nr:hypothetical protein Leryth_015267 [Lithospermum erythrorhizon]
MDLEAAKKLLESGGDEKFKTIIDSLPHRFMEPLIMKGIKVDLIQPGRLLCSFTVSSRLTNSANTLHGGVTASLVDIIGSAAVYTAGCPVTGVSVEINVSYMDAANVGDEVEIDARTLRVGKSIAVVSVELRKKKTGKIIAQGRHTKYLVVPSKM